MFGLSWESALDQGFVMNAMEACKKMDMDGTQLNKLWKTAEEKKQSIKFGGGFYCAKITVPTSMSPIQATKTPIVIAVEKPNDGGNEKIKQRISIVLTPSLDTSAAEKEEQKEFKFVEKKSVENQEEKKEDSPSEENETKKANEQDPSTKEKETSFDDPKV